MKEVKEKEKATIQQPLQGSPQDIANQLIALAKERKLTVEEIKKLTPITKEFLEAFGTAMKDALKGASENAKHFYESFDKIIDLYKEVLKDGSLTDSQKDKVLDQIKAATDQIYTFANDTQRGLTWLVALFGGFVTIIVTIIVIMTGGKPKEIINDKES